MSARILERVSLLGVPIDPLTRDQAVDELLHMLSGDTPCHVMTPNSEMLVEAFSNAAFKNVLQHSSLNIPDSAGLTYMAPITGQRIPQRVTGVDTVIRLARKLSEDEHVFLLGAKPGIADRAARALERVNPVISVVGTHAGSPNDEDAQQIIDKINVSGAHILLVAYGSPKQDMWIAKHISKLPNVRIAMGVGGTFDFLAKERTRAPQWMQTAGLEWLFRLIQEPKRIKRIWNAVVVFPYLVLRFGKDLPASKEG